MIFRFVGARALNTFGRASATVLWELYVRTGDPLVLAAEGGACLKTTLPAGATLTDVGPSGEMKTFTVKGDGTIAITVPPRSGRILVRK